MEQHTPIDLKSLPPALAAAIVIAQKSVRAVQKLGWNKHQEFAYATADEMISEGRAACNEAGLALLCLGWTFEPAAPGGREKDPIGRVHPLYLLAHESGVCVQLKSSTFVIPDRGRPADKAESASLTGNLGYVYRALLGLAREDAPPIDGRDDTDYQQGQQPREPERAPAPQQRQPPPASAASAAAPATGEDPGAVAMVAEFQRLLRDGKDAGDIYDSVMKANLPKPLRDRALFFVFEVAFTQAPDAETFDSWMPALKAAALIDDVKARLRPIVDAAGDRTGWEPKAA